MSEAAAPICRGWSWGERYEAVPPAGLLRGTLRAPVGGVGGEGSLEQAKSDFREHIQRTWSHPVLVRISILNAKTVSCLFILQRITVLGVCMGVG